MNESLLVVYGIMLGIMVAGISLRNYPMIAIPGFVEGVIWIIMRPPIVHAPSWAGVPLGVAIIALTLTWRTTVDDERPKGRHHPSTPPTGVNLNPISPDDVVKKDTETGVTWVDWGTPDLEDVVYTDDEFPYQHRIRQWKEGRETI